MSKYIDVDKLKAKIEKALKASELHRGEAAVDGSRQTLYWIKDVIISLQQEQQEPFSCGHENGSEPQREGYLEYWLEHFGMPKENIENCADQIAQGYGASRYLEGVRVGAEAVNELGKQEKGYYGAYLNECIAKASKTWEGVDADKYMDEVRGREQEQPQVADASKMEQEVDLEKEIDKGIADYSFTKTIDSGGFKTTVIDYAKIARHFYELGLKARKV